MSKNRGKLTVISLLVVIIVVCGGYILLHPSSSKKVASEKLLRQRRLQVAHLKSIKQPKKIVQIKLKMMTQMIRLQ